MTAPLSRDLRRRLVRAVDEGSTALEAAARFDVSASAAIKLVRRVRETGSTEPAKTRDMLCTTIGNRLDTFSPTECCNQLQKSGYACE